MGDNILSRADDKATVYSPDGKIVYTAQFNLFFIHASLQARNKLAGMLLILEDRCKNSIPAKGLSH